MRQSPDRILHGLVTMLFGTSICPLLAMTQKPGRVHPESACLLWIHAPDPICMNALDRNVLPRAPLRGVGPDGAGRTKTAQITRTAPLMTASARAAVLHPKCSMIAALNGGNASIPRPVPVAAMLKARVRHLSNQPPTTAKVGMYAQAAPRPTPSP